MGAILTAAEINAGLVRAKASEMDPHGKDLHTPGARGDGGKVRPALVLGGFARALWEISKVGTSGAAKYSDNGWMEMPDGAARCAESKMRHWLKECMGQEVDDESQYLHAAHEAWNALARLDLMLREREKAAASG